MSKPTRSEKAAQPVVEKVRAACLRRGSNGIRGLTRCFRIMDDNHSLSLSTEELRDGLQDMGVILRKDEVKLLVDAFDRNGDGTQLAIGVHRARTKGDTALNPSARGGELRRTRNHHLEKHMHSERILPMLLIGLICIHEFLVAIRGGMNERRRDVVMRAFEKMDRDGSGRIDLYDLRGVYDASGHPKVVSGEMTEEEALGTFLKTFDSTTNPDGVVTRDEFEAYYAGVSASIDDDDMFEEMVHRAWRLDEPLSRIQPNFTASRSIPSETITKANTMQKDDTVNYTLTSLEGITERPKPPPKPRRIVGYTGHVPGSQDTFGESFAAVESKSTVPPKKNKLPPPDFKDEANAFVKKGNAANVSSFRLE